MRLIILILAMFLLFSLVTIGYSITIDGVDYDEEVFCETDFEDQVIPNCLSFRSDEVCVIVGAAGQRVLECGADDKWRLNASAADENISLPANFTMVINVSVDQNGIGGNSIFWSIANSDRDTISSANVVADFRQVGGDPQLPEDWGFNKATAHPAAINGYDYSSGYDDYHDFRFTYFNDTKNYSYWASPSTENSPLGTYNSSVIVNTGEPVGAIYGKDPRQDTEADFIQNVTYFRISKLVKSPPADTTPPEITFYNMTSEGGEGCVAWNDDKQNPCNTTDSTPTVKINLSESSFCAISTLDLNYTDMIAEEPSTNCTDAPGKKLTCTLTDFKTLVGGRSNLFIGCKGTNGNENLSSTSGALLINVTIPPAPSVYDPIAVHLNGTEVISGFKKFLDNIVFTALATFFKITVNSGIETVNLTVNDTATVNLGNFGNLTVLGDLTVDANTLFVDSANNRVGIGTTSPARTLHISDTLRIEPRATAPSNPSSGDMYVDSSTSKQALCIFLDGKWERAGGKGQCPK